MPASEVTQESLSPSVNCSNEPSLEVRTVPGTEQALKERLLLLSLLLYCV